MEGVGATQAEPLWQGSEGAHCGHGGQQGQREVFGSYAKSIGDAVINQGPCLPSAHLKSGESSLARCGPGDEVISLALEALHDPLPRTSP